MGDYREAVQAYLAGTDSTPDITHHAALRRAQVRLRLQHRAGDHRQSAPLRPLRLERGPARVLRLHRGRPDRRDWAATTPCARWHRPQDKIGLAFVSNAIKRDHQNYLKYGGLGFLLGDGNLNYGRENIVESYYNLARLARPVLRPRCAAHQQPRLQPRPRPCLGGRLRTRPRGFLKGSKASRCGRARCVAFQRNEGAISIRRAPAPLPVTFPRTTSTITSPGLA